MPTIFLGQLQQLGALAAAERFIREVSHFVRNWLAIRACPPGNAVRYIARFPAGLVPVEGNCPVKALQIAGTEQGDYGISQGDWPPLFVVPDHLPLKSQEPVCLKFVQNRKHFHRRWSLWKSLILSARDGLAPLRKRLEISAPNDFVQLHKPKELRLLARPRNIQDRFAQTPLSSRKLNLPGQFLTGLRHARHAVNL